MKFNLSSLFLFVLLFICLVGLVDSNAQCAMCQATLESNAKTGSSQVGSTLNNGILYLMSIPYLLIGTVCFLWYRNSLKKKAESNGTVKNVTDTLSVLQS